MRLTIQSRSMRCVFASVWLAVAGWFIWEATSFAWVDAQLDSSNTKRVEQVVLRHPDDPRLHDQLGLLYSYSHPREIDAAVREFRTATQLNSRVPSYWADEGRACFVAGDKDCARKAFITATTVAPMTPRYWSEAATFLLALGEDKSAKTYLSHYLEMAPSTAPETLKFALRNFESPQIVWDSLLQKQSADVQLSLVEVLNDAGEYEQAKLYWREIAAARPKFALARVTGLLYGLEQRRDYGELHTVWRDLQLSRSIDVQDNGNLVYNGSFAHKPYDIGFDWHLTPNHLLTASIETLSGQAGRALHVIYSVPRNDDTEAATQIIPLQPGHRYELAAMVRSQNITSDSGPRFRVFDSACPACLDLSTEATLGTTAWHQQKLLFTTGPRTEYLTLSIWRPRSRSFPTEIEGEFWASSVSISELKASAGKEPAP